MSLGYSCVSQLGSHLEPAAPPGGTMKTSLISGREQLGGSHEVVLLISGSLIHQKSHCDSHFCSSSSGPQQELAMDRQASR